MTSTENDGLRQSAEGGGYGNAWSEEHRLEVAQYLARGLSGAEAGRKTGIPETTIRSWRADETFMATVARLRADLVEETSAGLTALGRMAVATLGNGMKGDATNVQVRAAHTTITLALQLRESVELEARIAALEAAAGGDG